MKFRCEGCLGKFAEDAMIEKLDPGGFRHLCVRKCARRWYAVKLFPLPNYAGGEKGWDDRPGPGDDGRSPKERMRGSGESRAKFRDDMVRRKIARAAKAAGLDHLFGRLLAPKMLTLHSTDDGRPRRRHEAFLQGYLAAEMVFTPETRALVEGVPGVQGFLPLLQPLGKVSITGKERKKSGGTKSEIEARECWRPTEMSYDEVQVLLFRDKARKSTPVPPTLTYREGDPVRVSKGPYSGVRGTVRRVEGADTPAPDVVVLMKVLGREVEVKVPFSVVSPE